MACLITLVTIYQNKWKDAFALIFPIEEAIFTNFVKEMLFMLKN